MVLKALKFGKQISRFGNDNPVLSDHQRMIVIMNNVSNEVDKTRCISQIGSIEAGNLILEGI